MEIRNRRNHILLRDKREETIEIISHGCHVCQSDNSLITFIQVFSRYPALRITRHLQDDEAFTW